MKTHRYLPLGAPNISSAEAHIITAEEGLQMVAAHHNDPTKPQDFPDWIHLDFLDEAYAALRTNPGHVGFRVARANNGHHRTVVIFSLDKDGNIIPGVAIENGQPCPPECP